MTVQAQSSRFGHSLPLDFSASLTISDDPTPRQTHADTPLLSAKRVGSDVEGKAIRECSIPDLPPELWTEILSYLPPGSVRKMIGITRFLFEQGMDEIYEEVEMVGYVNVGLKVMEQTRHPSIAARVRKLYINPAFLPVLDTEDAKTWDDNRIRKLEIDAFLTMSLNVLTTCPHLQELTVVLHDQYIPELFSTYLLKLMERVGSQLHTVTIKMTCYSVISVCRAFFQTLPNLSRLAVNIPKGRYEPHEPDARQACRVLAEILNSTAGTTRSLVFESVGFSLSHLLLKLDKFPFLESLEVRAKYGHNTLKPGTHLLSFIRENNSIQHLIIRQPLDLFPLEATPPRDTMLRLIFVPLLALPLSNLQELILELPSKILLPKLTHYLRTFAPRMRRLTLCGAHARVTYDDLCPLLNQLHDCGSHLEHLQITVNLFSVDLLELFSRTLPKLKTLNLCYELFGSLDPTKLSRREQYACYDAFRRLDCWKLEELKLTHLRRDDYWHSQGYTDE